MAKAKTSIAEVSKAKRSYTKRKQEAEAAEAQSAVIADERPREETINEAESVENIKPVETATDKAKREAEEAKETIEALKAENDELKSTLAEIKQQIAMLSAQQPTQVIQVSAATEMVHFLWMGEVANDNVMEFGPNGMYGRIIGRTGEFAVPKNDLSRILDGLNRYFIEKRWLIITSGLNENEREALGVNYSEGELLDRKAFDKMVDLGDELLTIYPQLCEGHKEMVAKRYYEAWQNSNPNVTRERVSALNAICKQNGGKHNSFAEILREMNEMEVNE